MSIDLLRKSKFSTNKTATEHIMVSTPDLNFASLLSEVFSSLVTQRKIFERERVRSGTFI